MSEAKDSTDGADPAPSRDTASESEDVVRRYKQIDTLLKKCGFFSSYINKKLETVYNNPEDDVQVVDVKTGKRKREDKDSNVSKHVKLTGEQGDDSKRMNASQIHIFGQTFDVKQPNLLDGGILRDYQLHGVQWLTLLFENGLNGILADEMGLGKTIQIIAFICHLYEKNLVGPFLIIGPLSTITNWKAEFNKFASKVPCVLYHGTVGERVLQKENVHNRYKLDGKQVYPVVITSYEISIKDKGFFFKYQWKYLIVDEGHRLKNYQSVLSRTLSLFPKVNSLLLTGTPLQNNLQELWSLLHFILPTVFDELGSFNEWLAVDDLNENSYKLIEKKNGTNMLSALHKILQPFMLRRVKNDVSLDLPPKKEVIIYCPLSNSQVELSMHVLEETHKRLNVKSAEELNKHEGRPKRRASLYNQLGSDERTMAKRCYTIPFQCQKLKGAHNKLQAPAPEEEDKFIRYKLKWNNISMMLRKVADHPFLLQETCDLPQTLDEETIKISGKFIILDILLMKLKERGHKVLIFSNFTSMLDLIEDLMYYRNYPFERLDGSVNLADREQRIKNYMTGENAFIFLISTRAGGLGISLTRADTVILYDSDWNPQVDLQAQDRCHRIGQKKPVMVYRLVSKGTVDEQIVNRATSKLKLERLVLPEGSFKHKDKIGEMIADIEQLKNQLNLTKLSFSADSLVFSDAEWENLLDRSSEKTSLKPI